MNTSIEFEDVLEKLLNKQRMVQDNLPEEPGLFLVRNLISKKVFIGSTNNLRQGITRDKFLLENDSHGNKEMQKDVKTYGIRAFQFEVLEVVNENNLTEAKCKHFEKLKDNCYNRFMRKPAIKPENGSATLDDFLKLIKKT
jgi:hypothetical protein